jgi:5-methylcytosine-specific restriction endonuclease McrA
MTRDEVFARDGHRCVYCGQVLPSEDLTIDHVQARSRGGDRSGGNLVTACRACNGRKGRRRLARFLADDPDAHRNFRRFATHVWRRHLRALEDEIRTRQRRIPSGL